MFPDLAFRTNFRAASRNGADQLKGGLGPYPFALANLPEVALIPANSNTNQNSYTNSDRDCAKRAFFGPCCNPTQSIVADPGAYLYCTPPQSGRFVARDTLATTETINNLV